MITEILAVDCPLGRRAGGRGVGAAGHPNARRGQLARHHGATGGQVPPGAQHGRGTITITAETLR